MCTTFLGFFFFFNDTATTEIYTLSLHDALPICALPLGLERREHERRGHQRPVDARRLRMVRRTPHAVVDANRRRDVTTRQRSEEHTSELQSRQYLVCRLLLEKKKDTAI